MQNQADELDVGPGLIKNRRNFDRKPDEVGSRLQLDG
jgi:hypothetical protein